MRSSSIGLLVAALLLLAASDARAWAIYLEELEPKIYTIGDTVTVTLRTDVDAPGVELLAINVLYDAGAFEYVSAASFVPSYVLFSPWEGKGAPSVYLAPGQDPPELWPAPPAGSQQVNVMFYEVNLNTTRATGDGILLATLVFHVAGFGDGTGRIDIATSYGGGVYRVNGIDRGHASGGTGELIESPGLVLVIPEPSTAVLLGVGVLALAVARRRSS